VKRAWVVHGSDGIDEVSISGTTLVCEVRDGALRTFEIVPGDAGLSTSALAALEGGSPAENAAAIRELFEGRPGPFRDAVVLNAAAGLVILGLAGDLTSGARMAAEAIDTGKAMQTLNGLVRLSQGGR